MQDTRVHLQLACCEMSDAIHDINHIVQTFFFFQISITWFNNSIFLICIYKYLKIQPTHFSFSYKYIFNKQGGESQANALFTFT